MLRGALAVARARSRTHARSTDVVDALARLAVRSDRAAVEVATEHWRPCVVPPVDRRWPGILPAVRPRPAIGRPAVWLRRAAIPCSGVRPRARHTLSNLATDGLDLAIEVLATVLTATPE